MTIPSSQFMSPYFGSAYSPGVGGSTGSTPSYLSPNSPYGQFQLQNSATLGQVGSILNPMSGGAMSPLSTGALSPTGSGQSPLELIMNILQMMMSLLMAILGGGMGGSSGSPSDSSGAGSSFDSSGSGGSSPEYGDSGSNSNGRAGGGHGHHRHGHHGHGGGSAGGPSGDSSGAPSATPSSSGEADHNYNPASTPSSTPAPGGKNNHRGGGPQGSGTQYNPGGGQQGGGSTGNLFSGGKEGLGVSPTSSNGDGSNLGSTKASWYYNWGPSASSNVNDPNATFIPMIWGKKNMNAKDIQAAANSKSPMILTFNEPDLPSQGNMSVQDALSYWPQLEATGKQLSSPAVSNGPDGVKWLDQFMAGAKAGGHRVDSISLHWYGSKSKSPEQNVADLKGYIDQVHQKYPDLPINLTEFGVDPNGLTAAKDPAFLSKAEDMLNGLPYVQMYSPYGLGDINGNQ